MSAKVYKEEDSKPHAKARKQYAKQVSHTIMLCGRAVMLNHPFTKLAIQEKKKKKDVGNMFF